MVWCQAMALSIKVYGDLHVTLAMKWKVLLSEHAKLMACGLAILPFVQVSKSVRLAHLSPELWSSKAPLDYLIGLYLLIPTFCVLENLKLLSWFLAVVNCSALDPPENGEKSGNSATYQSIATFSCDTGHFLTGSRNRTCQSDSTWSGMETVCSSKHSLSARCCLICALFI